MDDGCTGLIATAVPIGGDNDTPVTFEEGRHYLLRSLADLEALGFAEEAGGANGRVWKCVRDFYREAPSGTKLHLMGYRNEAADDLIISATENKGLLDKAGGEIRTLIVLPIKPINDSSIIIMQREIERYIERSNAPVMALAGATLGERDFDFNPNNLSISCNRVGVVIGSESADDTMGAVGLVAGRIAAIPVQRSIGRVRDGGIPATSMFFGSEEVDNGSAEVYRDMGFIVPRTFAGRGGYYWADDCLCAPVSDDYALIPRRRVIDKAARVAYTAMLNYVNEEIPVTAEGKITAPMCKAIEASVRSAIVAQMTDEGNLATDTSDPNDVGCSVYVDPDQNILATSKLNVQLHVRPYGYAKYIEVNLGFETGSN